MSVRAWEKGRRVLRNSLRSVYLIGPLMMGIWAIQSHAADSLPVALGGPFRPDEHTVVLYHFDEGEGTQTRDAMGDPALTLKAYKHFLWGSRPGFGSTAGFTPRKDDANLLLGPVNNDKLELRTCTKAWTVEAWVRYTGLALSGVQLDHPASYRPYGSGTAGPFAKICGTDDEGFSLPHGVRGGWDFSLHSWLDAWPVKPGLLPASRFIGSQRRVPDSDALVYPGRKAGAGTVIHEAAIQDEEWHHVAWQFRYEDQTHFFFLDGKLIWKDTPQRRVINDAERNDVPFMVGGILNSLDPPYHVKTYDFEGELDELRISSVLRYPIAEELTVVERLLPEAGLHSPYTVKFSTDVAEGAVRWELDGELPDGLRFDEAEGKIEGAPTEPARERAITLRATDSTGRQDEHAFAITVSEAEVVTASLPLAFRGRPYREVLETRYTVEPVSWRKTEGVLPNGISLSKGGELSGTAATLGLESIRLEATDAAGQKVEILSNVVDSEVRRRSPGPSNRP
jgi:hypothetical protein